MKELERDDVFVRCHGPFPMGYVYQGHRHWIDHNSFVHEGTRLKVRYRHRKEGPVVKESIYSGPCRFLVAAGLFHEIEVCSEEGYWDCEFKKFGSDSPLHGVFNKELFD